MLEADQENVTDEIGSGSDDEQRINSVQGPHVMCHA